MVSIQDVNSLFNISIPHEEVDTIGLYIFMLNMDKTGATYNIENVTFKVRSVDDNQIRQIEIWKN